MVKKEIHLRLVVSQQVIQMLMITQTGTLIKPMSDTNYFKTAGVSVSLGKQLKWPDDYFTLDLFIELYTLQPEKLPDFPGIVAMVLQLT